jgi:hypothetical protein
MTYYCKHILPSAVLCIHLLAYAIYKSIFLLKLLLFYILLFLVSSKFWVKETDLQDQIYAYI